MRLKILENVPQLNLISDISIAEDLYCLKAVDSNFVQNGGNITRTHSALCNWAVYPIKSLTMSSFDCVLWKYKQDSAFRVSGVLQLANTGSPVMKNFPLFLLFLSNAMMARKFYTPYDVNCTNLHILPARNFAHFDSNWPPSKLEEKFVRACPKPKLQNDESEDHRLQYLKKKQVGENFVS